MIRSILVAGRRAVSFRGIALVLLVASAGAGSACGHDIAKVGVLVDRVGVAKVRIEPSSKESPSQEYVAGSYRRQMRADVLGDGAEETIVEIGSGKGLDILDSFDAALARVPTDDYLTHFGSVESTPGKRDLVLHTYPNAERGGTFTILRLPEKATMAAWKEKPPPSRFDVSSWNGEPAIFYFQGDSLVVRSTSGRLLERFELPGAGLMSRIHVARLDSTVCVLGSGSGYTPYHMIWVLDLKGQLLFQEVGHEHAFRLDASPGGVGCDVSARSVQWRYEVPRHSQ